MENSSIIVLGILFGGAFLCFVYLALSFSDALPTCLNCLKPVSKKIFLNKNQPSSSSNDYIKNQNSSNDINLKKDVELGSTGTIIPTMTASTKISPSVETDIENPSILDSLNSISDDVNPAGEASVNLERQASLVKN